MLFTGMLTVEQMDEPIAVLEVYGLSTRTISMLEDNFDAVYIRDLRKYTVDDIRDVDEFGEKTVREMIEVIRRFAG